MSYFAGLISTLILISGALARADNQDVSKLYEGILPNSGEAAVTGNGSVTDPVQPMTAPPSTPLKSDGKLDKEDIKSLFSGELPAVAHAQKYYDKGNGQPRCAADWKRLRRLPVNEKGVRVGLATFLKNAKKVGASVSKLKRLLATFLANQNQIPNQDYISFIDFDIASNKERMYIVNLRTGQITAHKAAHGSGSGGYAAVPNRFSNASGTNASSLGCALATFYKDSSGHEQIDGHDHHYLTLQGFEASNDNLCNRASYLHEGTVLKTVRRKVSGRTVARKVWEDYTSGGGRSEGCPALVPTERLGIFKELSGGGLICNYKDGPWKPASLPRPRHLN